jgi:hypothetical protein
MFVKVRVDASLSTGDVVSFDSASQSWTPAVDLSALVGILRTAPAQVEGEDFSTAEVVFSGLAYARASRDIPAEGGMMSIESGGVYVAPVSDACGAVAPAPYNATAPRPAGDLVMVHLR